MNTFEKVDDNTIKVTKTEETISEVTHSYEYLILQRASIIKDKENYIALRDKEIAEIDAILAECVTLSIGVKEDIKEVSEEIIIK